MYAEEKIKTPLNIIQGFQWLNILFHIYSILYMYTVIYF